VALYFYYPTLDTCRLLPRQDREVGPRRFSDLVRRPSPGGKVAQLENALHAAGNHVRPAGQ